MKFVGNGYLVCVSEYDAKDKQGQPVGHRWKYDFIVGDENEFGFIVDPVLQNCISDHQLLTGKEKLMSKVKVECEIRTFRKFVDGRYVEQQEPSYKLADVTVG